MKRRILPVVVSLVLVVTVAVVPSSKAGSSAVPTQFAYMFDESWQSADPTYSGFASKAEFLAEVETYIQEISAFVNRPDWYKDRTQMQAPDDEKYYVVYALFDGTSNARSVSIVLLNRIQFEHGLAGIAHETAHIICHDSDSTSIREGFACYCQDKFGKTPNPTCFGLDVNVLANMVLTTHPDSFDALFPGVGLEGSFAYGSSQERFYILSDSFTTYLIDNYGVDKYMKLYESTNSPDDYQSIYGKSYDNIKADWRKLIENCPNTITQEEFTAHQIKIASENHYPMS